MNHEPKDDRDYLRQVVFDGYCLRTWPTNKRYPTGQEIIGAELVNPDGVTLFSQESFGIAPGYAIDSDKALREVISWLTLKPGDTDRDHFDNYTPEQMAFAKGDAAMLSLWADEDAGKPNTHFDGSEYTPDEYQFTNIDDWVDSDSDESDESDEEESEEDEQERLREAEDAFRRRYGDDAITIDKPDEAYSRHDPKGWCGDAARGAAMGRRDYKGDPDFGGVITLRAVQLDGDYDVNGTYWGGGGAPLWWYGNEEEDFEGTVRASGRDAAKKEILKDYPNARFNR